ncbi:hypothetical protein [Desulfosporosinus sp. BICA1-9]|uniref:hypothetical protein n=1 Tax=Desulfosporosinus sp. BICA1-9 TaxID=1531958 RepID=UPI00054C4DB6|nr:hypothetical protein [Desulfosporosinus sp. BICA1-9]KJS47357.1 MAG: hypothetical protein VR66_20195 [Peptococcaceae bacterium BRH_c23]KJS90211.1 MAG: hypothetical protein JL57_03260 [Desulfosporosinus sp. BICA1-9]HBW37060.1 hypothetical protein [Desulfosporosinus sp.]
MLTLSAKIEFVKFMNEKFLGKNLESIEVSSVIDCTVDFGVVEYIDVADDKVSVWGPESRVFWINLNDVLVVDYNPREEGVCVLIEAKNKVEVRFKVV